MFRNVCIPIDMILQSSKYWCSAYNDIKTQKAEMLRRYRFCQTNTSPQTYFNSVERVRPCIFHYMKYYRQKFYETFSRSINYCSSFLFKHLLKNPENINGSNLQACCHTESSFY